MSTYFCYPVITKPTRVIKNSATLIEYLWTDNINNIQESHILLNYMTDHFPSISTFTKQALGPGQPNEFKYVKQRLYSDNESGRTTHVPYARTWSFEIRFDTKILSVHDQIVWTNRISGRISGWISGSSLSFHNYFRKVLYISPPNFVRIC